MAEIIKLDGTQALDFDREMVETAYDRWAPIYDLVFGGVFSKGRRAAILASDIVLIPVQPSPYDVWAAADTVELIREASVPPTPRRPTRPTRGSKERRLETKKNRSNIKNLRQGKPSLD